jgi:hypothetical protein
MLNRHNCRENQNTVCVQQHLYRNHAVYEIKWNNYGTVRQATEYMIWRMRFACCMNTAKDTQPEYVLLIAFYGTYC